MTKQDSGIIGYGGSSSIFSMDESLLNFPGSAFQALSFCCTPIELLSNDGKDTVIGRGSAFFYKHEGISLLVTNWHVISGRNIFTRELISDKGFIPSRLRYHGVTLALIDNQVVFTRNSWTVLLPEMAQSMMEEPPLIEGTPVDIWAVPVLAHSLISKDPGRQGFQGASGLSSYVNDHVSNIGCLAGDDCLILGYPLSNYEGLKPPIWKRASLASEPGIPVDGRPMFLIDGTTTASMSGSPIFRRIVTGVARDEKRGAIVEQTVFAFLGVYAGRLQAADLMNTGLGYGWYGSLIGKVAKYYGYESNPLKPGSFEENGFDSDGRPLI